MYHTTLTDNTKDLVADMADSFVQFSTAESLFHRISAINLSEPKAYLN